MFFSGFGCILSAPLALEQHSACVSFLHKCLFWIVRWSMRVLCLRETKTVYLLNRGSRVDSEADSDLFCNSFTPLNAGFAGRLCGNAISPQYWLNLWLLHEYSLHWPFFETPQEPRFLGQILCRTGSGILRLYVSKQSALFGINRRKQST